MSSDQNPAKDFKKRDVERSFQRFSNYTSYVFQSENVTFPNNFDILINFWETDEVMSVITAQLKQIDISYDDWFNNLRHISNNIRREFRLPLDEVKRTALLYKICLKTFTSDINVGTFSENFIHVQDLEVTIRFFNKNIVIPLTDSIGYKIADISDTIDEQYKEQIMVPVTILNVFNDNKVMIGNNNEFKSEAAIGRGANIEKERLI